MIDLTQLPPEGLRLHGSMDSLPLADGEALRSVDWNLLLMPSDGDFFVEIKASAVWEGACSRCLEPLDQSLSLSTQFLGSKDPELAVRGAHTLGSQDLDVVFIPESELDEGVLVKEQLQLQIPMRPLCKEECSGLCPQCGKNWNKGLCNCRPELNKEPGALAKALSGLKLSLGDSEPGAGR